jgi:predicted component of type VI protein secretion system
VLINLRKQIKEFAKRAEECARQAETAPSAVRDHYRQLEKHWLLLAQHYFITLEEAERFHGPSVHRNEPAGASVFER